MKLVHVFPPHFPKIYSNIIPPSTPISSEWTLPSRFSYHSFVWIYLSHTCYMSCPSYPWLDLPNYIWWSLQVMKLLIMQSSPAFHHFLPLRHKYSPWHLVVKRLQWFSLGVRDKVSHPYKTTGKIVVLSELQNLQCFNTTIFCPVPVIRSHVRSREYSTKSMWIWQ